LNACHGSTIGPHLQHLFLLYPLVFVLSSLLNIYSAASVDYIKYIQAYIT